MFYNRREGEETKNGINYYPLDDTQNFGFVLKTDRFIVRIRYSKRIKKWFINFHWFTKKEILENLLYKIMNKDKR